MPVKDMLHFMDNKTLCDIYIAPYSARSCSKVLYNIIYNIIIPDSWKNMIISAYGIQKLYISIYIYQLVIQCGKIRSTSR